MWFHPGNGRAPEVGAAYVFVRAADRPVCIQQAKVTAADDAEGDHFGWSVAILADTMLAGASAHETGGTDVAGAACVFTRTPCGAWAPQDELTAVGDEFGLRSLSPLRPRFVGVPYRVLASIFHEGSRDFFRRADLTPSRQRAPRVSTTKGAAGASRRRERSCGLALGVFEHAAAGPASNCVCE